MTPEEAALVRESGAALGIRFDDAALARIDRHLDVLEIWNRRTRLTGERDRRTILVRHVVDSLAPVKWLPASGLVIDIGSGAGFPGIVLGCLRPDLRLVLIEARRRRASFLGEAIRTVPLPLARVIGRRAEDAAAGDLARSGDVVVTRALRLDAFLVLATDLVAPDGLAIAMQTPRARETAAAIATPRGFRLADATDYALPGSRTRTLLVFRRVP